MTDSCRFYCVPEHSSLSHGKSAFVKKSHVSCRAWGHDKRGTMGYSGSLLCVYYVNGFGKQTMQCKRMKTLKVKNWKETDKDRTWRELAEKAKTHKGL